jgi:hypothetical protein
MIDTLAHILGAGIIWLTLAFLLALLIAPALAERFDEDDYAFDYDPDFAALVEPITEQAKRNDLLCPRTNYDIEYAVPLSRVWRVQEMRKERS